MRAPIAVTELADAFDRHRLPRMEAGRREPALALVIAGPGTNRDRDMALALQLAGAEPTVVLADELAADPKPLADARIVVIAGGFSYGDALGAGRMLALDLMAGWARHCRSTSPRVAR